eukprot:1512395-Amphidinium_carterae.1
MITSPLTAPTMTSDTYTKMLRIVFVLPRCKFWDAKNKLKSVIHYNHFLRKFLCDGRQEYAAALASKMAELDTQEDKW